MKQPLRIRARSARRADGHRRARPSVESCEPRRLLATFVVTSAGDNGDNLNPIPGSVRQAILQSDENPAASGSNLIVFRLGTPDAVIQPTGPLPALTDPVTVDGGNSPSGGPDVVLDGSISSDQSTSAYGLTVLGSGSVIEGLVIDNFAGSGLVLASDSNTVAEDYLGVGANGTSRAGNGVDGVQVLDSTGNTIEASVISANLANGVELDDANASDNLLTGNLIGLDAAGEAAAPNGFTGVRIVGGSGNTIGGSLPADRNVISANGTSTISGTADCGIDLQADASTNSPAESNLIIGNYIGTDEGGTKRFGNTTDGIQLDQVLDNTIANNVIGFNGADGVELDGAIATGNLLVGNLIGLDATGEMAAPNGLQGIELYGAPGNTIGGASAADRNVISANGTSVTPGSGDSGIYLQNDNEGSAASDNEIEGNDIGTDSAGTAGFGNTNDGIHVDQVPDNFIGLNVIAFNGADGVELDGAMATDNDLYGNIIGLDSTGEAAAPNALEGVRLYGAPDNFIDGLNVISGNLDSGIYLQVDNEGSAASGNMISGDYIGTDITGSVPFGNKNDGIAINNVSNNQIGFDGAGNVIGASGGNGVSINGQGASGNVLVANLIGVGVTGEARFGNALDGVRIENSSDNTVGGSAAGDGNIISDNGGNGIEIVNNGNQADTTTGNLVVGNTIGLDVLGVSAIPNLLNGILIDGSEFNTIGGTSATDRNLISGNNQNGIEIESNGLNTVGVTADDNLVQGNDIGSDTTGTKDQGNLGAGLRVVNGSGNLIGGDVPGAGNLIMSNGAQGIAVYGYQVTSPTDPSIVIDNTSEGDLIQGNIIGADETGTLPFPNQSDGVLINDSIGDTIGGTTTLARNVIYDNNGNGINLAFLSDSDAVLGNDIGIGADDETGIGNHGSGVLLDGSSNDTIGGTVAGAGNVISNNQVSGIDLSLSSSNNLVEQNVIGTDPTGQVAEGNGLNGVSIESGSSGNTIGGLAGAATRNLISGNTESGVAISQGFFGQVSGNVIAGDYIGTDVSGTTNVGAFQTALGNQADGIVISGAPDNTIGGDLISGNALDGMLIAGSTATGNLVFADSIGVNVGGSALGNDQDGIFIVEAPGNEIGEPNALNPDGSIAGLLGDVISNNSGVGVQIFGIGSTGNDLQGDLIGTDSTGSIAEGNLEGGVLIDDSSNNVIGGVVPGSRDIISANFSDGVQIQASNPSAAMGNLLVGDSIGVGSTGLPLGNSGDGVLVRAATTSDIAGDVISANSGSGVELLQSSGDLLTADRIGTDPTGSTAEGNATGGLMVSDDSSGIGIGGSLPGDGDLISGNSGDGIAILAGSSGIGIVGDLIGTNASGSLALANGVDGVFVQDAGAANSILGDLVSANIAAGVEITDDSLPVAIQGNVIGLNAARDAALGNSYGVFLNGAVGITVGGTVAGVGNLISGNQDGVVITSAGTDPAGDAIQGNLIGTDGTGDGLPGGTPQQYGIFLNGSPFDTIGGTTPGARNVISGNATDGVLILNQIGSSALDTVDPNLNLDDVVQGNFIGTTVDGNPLLNASGAPVQGAGVVINASAGNVIGGVDSAATDLIAGNTVGVEVTGVVSSIDPQAQQGNVIASETIVRNTFGIFINGGQDVLAVSDNLSFNTEIGLSIVGATAQGNVVENDLISENGSLASGATAGSTVGDGIYIESAADNTIQSNLIDQNGIPTNTKTGQTANGVGLYIFDNARGDQVGKNTLQGNTGYGILVYNSASDLGGVHLNGPSQNTIKSSGIASFREYTGPVTTKATTPKGPKTKKK
jgi:hypothetical protein